MTGKWNSQSNAANGKSASWRVAPNTLATPESPAASWLSAITRLLEEQRDLCRGLDALSQQQRACVDREDAPAVLAVLGERQAVIERLQTVGKGLEPLIADHERHARSMTPPQRQSYDALVSEVAGLLDAVKARDAADRVSLERQRDAVTRELTGVAKGRGAAAAYGAGAPASSANFGAMYQDKQG